MTFAYSAGLLALVFLAHETVTPMTETTRALRLDVQQRDGAIEVQLIGQTAHTQRVSYTIEVTGRSTSRHHGETTLAAGTTAVLSTMRASTGPTWCVKLAAQEAGREPYEIIEGSCPSAAD